MDGRELVLEEGRVVGEFGLPQPVQSEVLLAVDEREALGKVLGEEFVDDREGAVESRVGLFDMGHEGVVIDCRTIGEGCQPVAHIDTAAREAQLFEMPEGPLHGPLFGAQFRGVALVQAAPFALERHALGETVGGQRIVAVVGVFGRESVDVVAFGLVAPAGEGAQIFGPVDVVLQRAVRLEGECPEVHAADHVAPFVRQPDDPQPLAVGMGVLAQQGDDRGEIPFAHGLHVADALASVDAEADDQESPDLGPCAAVDLLPAEHVGESQVAVADARRHRISFDDGPVLKPDGLELNHARCSSCVRCGCSTAVRVPGTATAGSRPANRPVRRRPHRAPRRRR